jgi:hypothetical protein
MSSLKLRRIPERYHATLTGTAMTIALTGVVSFALTVKTVGLTPDALIRSLAAWQISTAIAVPARFALLPLISKLVSLVVERPLPHR